jgi:uncharacterized protein YdaL
MNSPLRIQKICAPFLLAALLASCGGGGSAGGSAVSASESGSTPVISPQGASSPPVTVVPGLAGGTDTGIGDTGNNAGTGSTGSTAVGPVITPASPTTARSIAGPALAVLPPGPRTLVLYDAPPGSTYEKLGLSYAIMLRNLLGHFNAQVSLLPVQQYAAGMTEAHDATFYLGALYDNRLPPAFLADAATTQKTLVWFKYNLWQLAGDPAYNFAQTRGFTFTALRGMNAVPSAANPEPGFFDTVTYKNKPFLKYYAFDAARNVINADPEVGITTIVDTAKAGALVNVSNPKTGEQAPYVLRSGKFWYVADVPFSYIGPRDRYLVLADLLHDMLDVQHAESHQAMVRLEDVDAKVSAQAMKTITDYLSGNRIPFSIAMIPHYVDALGTNNGGTPEEIPLAQATDLKQALGYALLRGGEVVMHGYTHQYGAMRNPWSGASGDDYEFWDIVNNAPVPEDSTGWALGRLDAGLLEMRQNGYEPVAWETPHYHASPLASKAVPLVFNTTYQRVVYFTADKPNFNAATGKDFSAGQLFPYVIQKDHYGQRVLPENLGNIEYDIRNVDPTSNYDYRWQDLALNAEYALTVRDGFASFFFHPFWVEPEMNTPGMDDLKKTVEAITRLGFTWVAPSAVP